MGIFMKMDSQICEVQRSDNVSFQMKNYLNKMKTYAPDCPANEHNGFTGHTAKCRTLQMVK
jgi:hypothetical protein